MPFEIIPAAEGFGRGAGLLAARSAPHEFGPRRAGGLTGGRGAGRAPALARAHTPGARAGRHSRTGVWLVMEEGLCESNSFLGHCCHRGEHFIIPCQNERVGTGGRGERAESPRRGGLGPLLTLRGPCRSRLGLCPQGLAKSSTLQLLKSLPSYPL